MVLIIYLYLFLNLTSRYAFAQIGRGTIISENTCVRIGPGEDYKAVGSLNKGDSRVIKECRKGWVRWDTDSESWSQETDVRIEYFASNEKEDMEKEPPPENLIKYTKDTEDTDSKKPKNIIKQPPPIKEPNKELIKKPDKQAPPNKELPPSEEEVDKVSEIPYTTVNNPEEIPPEEIPPEEIPPEEIPPGEKSEDKDKKPRVIIFASYIWSNFRPIGVKLDELLWKKAKVLDITCGLVILIFFMQMIRQSSIIKDFWEKLDRWC